MINYEEIRLSLTDLYMEAKIDIFGGEDIHNECMASNLAPRSLYTVSHKIFHPYIRSM